MWSKTNYKGEIDVWYSEKEYQKLKDKIKKIKEISDFECKCGHNQMCICNICNKFDEILEVIEEKDNGKD